MRMAEMPPAQSGLLAVAAKLTGEPYCPLMGDVTLTTGVVPKTGIVSTANPQRASAIRGANRTAFTEHLWRKIDWRKINWTKINRTKINWTKIDNKAREASICESICPHHKADSLG